MNANEPPPDTRLPVGNDPPEFARAAHPGDLTPFIRVLRSGRTLHREEARDAFQSMMSGDAHHAEMGALLALLAMRVPTVDELVGAASVMRAHVDRVESSIPRDEILDTAGTGGTAKLFNVSTAAALVAAGAGIKVAKHGNRSRTGRGSAEVLAELGVNVDADRSLQRACLEEAGICFCFAVHHHPAARHAMPVRRALGIPTIFNLLGPLTNPAGAGRQLVGVYAEQFVAPVAQALAALGSRSALVVHGTDGLDEVSLSASTTVAHLMNGGILQYSVSPQSLGFPAADRASLQVHDLRSAATLIVQLLSGKLAGPMRDMLVVNAAAAIVAAGREASLVDARPVAERAIDSGAAMAALERLRAIAPRT